MHDISGKRPALETASAASAAQMNLQHLQALGSRLRGNDNIYSRVLAPRSHTGMFVGRQIISCPGLSCRFTILAK
jgi:hypothetical protein